MTTRNKVIIGIILIILLILSIFIFNKNKKIIFKTNNRNENINQIYIYDDLKVYDKYKSKKVIGSVESDEWFDIIDTIQDKHDIWYKIKSNNRYGYIKGVDNYKKHVEEYITIIEDENVINVFYDIDDDLTEFDDSFKDSDVKIQKYNILFRESYKLYYSLSKEKKLSRTPLVVVNDTTFESYVSAYNEFINDALDKDEPSNTLSKLTFKVDKKTCIKDRDNYLSTKTYNKTKKEYEETIKELKENINRSEQLIEETGGFLTEEMFKKIADQTTNSSALEALKQRYVLIDTYNRLKDNLKTTEDLYNTLVNNQESREEVSNYVFKCE